MTVTLGGDVRDRQEGRAEGELRGAPGAGAASILKGERASLAFVAPRHRGEADWPWITDVGVMRQFRFRRLFIDNTYARAPKLTGAYRRWQYWRSAWALRSARLAFLFSTDVGIGMTRGVAGMLASVPRVYVGFTQDGPWAPRRIEAVGGGLRRCDVVTVFTEEERLVYVDRYGLDARRVRVIPLHTDEAEGYGRYAEDSPRARPYVLSLGSPNRRFMAVARACRALGVELVIITRPHHQNDSLEELAGTGAAIITDADRMRALTYLKHARVAVAAFDDPGIAGGFTTLVHAMFLRTPFVVTRSLGMMEHVVNGQTGFVIPHGDENGLREAIGQVWEDGELAERLGRAALRRAKARHSLAAAAASFGGLAREMLMER